MHCDKKSLRHRSMLESPLGTLLVEADEGGITRVLFVDDINEAKTSLSGPVLAQQHVNQACTQLTEYFNGQRTQFELPLNPQGTVFQKRVWQALSTIEFGRRCSYSDLAQRIGNPNAVRAVGSANGRNPIAIIVPCHRVIGKNGTLTGYAWGVERKARLLALEGQSTADKSNAMTQQMLADF